MSKKVLVIDFPIFLLFFNTKFLIFSIISILSVLFSYFLNNHTAGHPVLWSKWSRISDPDLDHPSGMHQNIINPAKINLVIDSSKTHIVGILSLANGGWARRQKRARGPQRRRKKETGGTKKEGTRKTCKYIALIAFGKINWKFMEITEKY